MNDGVLFGIYVCVLIITACVVYTTITLAIGEVSVVVVTP